MTVAEIIVYILGPVAAYFLGSIPFGFVIGKAHGIDLRTVGSKNIGATNLGRTLGLKYFWYAFLLDAAKGFVPTIAMSILMHSADLPAWTPILTGAGAMIGHIYPIYLKFRGGKGVATSFGIVMGVWPVFTLAGIGGALTFLIVFLGWRYISLASIIGSIAFSACVIYLAQNSSFIHTRIPPEDFWPIVSISLLFTLLIILKHRSNIKRLLSGTEPKVGGKKTSGK